MVDGYPDSGNVDDYTDEQLKALSGMDKTALTKNQKAAVARWKFKQSPAAAAAGEAKPAAPKAAPAAAAPAAPAGPSPEELARQKAREQALGFPYAKELAETFPDAVVEVAMQTTKPYVVLKAAEVPKVLRYAKDVLGFDGLLCLTAADYPPDRLEVVYNLYSYSTKQHLAVKAKVPRDGDACAVPTVSHLWAGANWLEREVLDMFGVAFPGHPYPKRLLLPEGWSGYPLRKDYDMSKEQFVHVDERGDDVVTFEEKDGW